MWKKIYHQIEAPLELLKLGNQIERFLVENVLARFARAQIRVNKSKYVSIFFVTSQSVTGKLIARDRNFSRHILDVVARRHVATFWKNRLPSSGTIINSSVNRSSLEKTWPTTRIYQWWGVSDT